VQALHSTLSGLRSLGLQTSPLIERLKFFSAKEGKERTYGLSFVFLRHFRSEPFEGGSNLPCVRIKHHTSSKPIHAAGRGSVRISSHTHRYLNVLFYTHYAPDGHSVRLCVGNIHSLATEYSYIMDNLIVSSANWRSSQIPNDHALIAARIHMHYAQFKNARGKFIMGLRTATPKLRSLPL